MGKWLWLLAAVVAPALFAPGAFAMNFTDSGLFSPTVNANISLSQGMITLGNDTAQSYNANGSIRSVEFDAGQVVAWGSYFANSTMNSSENYLSMRFTVRNDSSQYIGLASLPLMGRYISYEMNLSSNNNQTRPVVDVVNISYSYVMPSVQAVSPADSFQAATNAVSLNCSASSVNGLKNISIFWNESGWSANYTSDLSGAYGYANKTITGFASGAYKWACIAYDSKNNSAWGQNMTIIYSQDSSKPVLAANVSSSLVAVGSQVSLAAFASDVSMSRIWVNLTYPNGSSARFGLANGGYVNITATLAGNYIAAFFANDTSGNTANSSLVFTAAVVSNTMFSVTNKTGWNLTSNITLYNAGSQDAAASFSSNLSGFGLPKPLMNRSYDMRVDAYGGRLSLTLSGFVPASNTNKRMMIDTPLVPGFFMVYAVNNSYSFSNATVRIYYDALDSSVEDMLEMEKCANWDFSAASCAGNWTAINFTLNKGSNYIEAFASSFSAYGIKEGAFCGDGTCDPSETPANCDLDCACINGQTRRCSASYSGICAVGSEACTGGAWVGCPLPAVETCNQLDDDCDGIVDNVAGGDSVESTGCGCFSGSLPKAEACNGIDDNCNGLIDEALNRSCGVALGECRRGMSLCESGSWGVCSGGIEPAQEVCGNGLDENCNGIADDGCASEEPCSTGAVPDSGCKCGGTTRTGGYCCYGSFQDGPCARLPWELLVVIGIIGVAIAVAVSFARKKGRQSSWEALEKKYSAPEKGAGE